MIEEIKPSIKESLQSSECVQIIKALLFALGVPLLYALFTVALFNSEWANDTLSTMTCGFLILVPIAMGALTVGFSPLEDRSSLAYAIVMPWLSVFITMIAVSIFALEAMICLVMALPVFMLLSSIGGIIPYIRRTSSKKHKSALGVMMLAPYLITPLEMQTANPDTMYTVRNQIVIEAGVDTVWQNIITVPMIGPDEQRFSIFHLLGLPKPLEATLSHKGVGGVRHASFENNLVFIEEITEWTEHESLSFRIDRDKQRMLNGALNEIGGQYFDIIDGTYQIEQVDDNRVILHLQSTHRLSTRFDTYGSLWTRWVMWDLQDYIIEVIKERCENQATNIGTTRVELTQADAQ